MVVMPSTTPSTVLSSSKKVERHKIPLPALGSGRSEGFVPRKIIDGFKDDAKKRINSISSSRFRNHDLTPKKVLRINIDEDSHDDDQRELVDDCNNEIEATTRETKHVLERHVKKRSSVRKHSDTSKLLRFKAACNRYRAACMTENEIRMLRMVEKPVDPLEPANNLDKLLGALNVSDHKNREARDALSSRIREEIYVKEKERRDQQVLMVLMKLRSKRSMLPSSSRVVMNQEEEERTL